MQNILQLIATFLGNVIKNIINGSTAVGNALRLNNKTLGDIETERDQAITTATSTVLTTLRDGVPAAGDTLKKLHDLIEALDNDSITQAELDAAIAALVGTAPDALNTLQELADAFNNSPTALQDLITLVGSKANSADVYTQNQLYTRAESDDRFINVDELGTFAEFETAFNDALNA